MTEIAQACGFNGSSYYAETFRKIVGLSPGSYQKRLLFSRSNLNQTSRHN
ncbi:MAG: helix-turn-helix domain-containing protein [Spirochaetaceae bacterium]|nr:helix-turn-helix domain-containing protein [Spirochaetaceae bacterium]